MIISSSNSVKATSPQTFTSAPPAIRYIRRRSSSAILFFNRSTKISYCFYLLYTQMLTFALFFHILLEFSTILIAVYYLEYHKSLQPKIFRLPLCSSHLAASQKTLPNMLPPTPPAYRIRNGWYSSKSFCSMALVNAFTWYCIAPRKLIFSTVVPK